MFRLSILLLFASDGSQVSQFVTSLRTVRRKALD